MTAASGTGPEFVPVPVDLGQALAFPGIYLELPARMPAVSAPARVRRPRQGAVRRMAARVAVVAAAGLAVLGWAGTARAATVTPAAEWHACHLAVVVHEHRLQDVAVPHAAYLQAWDAADHADPELRAGIRRYLRTDRGWINVVGDCDPDGWS